MSDHVVPVRVYLFIFGTLIVLTALTVWVAFIDLGLLNTFAALTIAVVKATLVVLYFMHVRYSSRLTWACALSGFVWLVFLLVFVIGDSVSRGWLGVPTPWN